MGRLRTVQMVALFTAITVAHGQAPRLPSADSLDRIIRAQVDSGFSGVVLVAAGDSIVLHRAYSSRRVPLDTGSAFWIASITKSFTAVAILQLQQDGRLSVRDSLYRFFPDAPPDKRAITIHQLLSHTSGIADSYDARTTDRAVAVRAILKLPLTSLPGRDYAYENSDYRLLAAVIEAETGQSWEQVIQTQLLDPFGLRHTGFWCDHRSGVPTPVAGPRAVACAKDWAHRGADGMSSTAADLLRWLRVQGGPDRLQNLDAVGIPHVLVRKEPPFDVYYGYGARVYVRRGKVEEIMNSGSGDDGHTSIAFVRSSGLSVIVLANAGSHGRGTWASYVAQLIAPRG